MILSFAFPCREIPSVVPWLSQAITFTAERFRTMPSPGLHC
jgi:hypothetical protein